MERYVDYRLIERGPGSDIEANPGVTKTELVQHGLRALFARDAAERLANIGGSAPRAKPPK